MNHSFKPIFLISLPRSGSTLLQKIMMAHDCIASTAEPWFLLPLSYMRHKSSGKAEYGFNQAINAFMRIEADCGQDHIDRLVSNFAYDIYGKYVLSNEDYFLDKTPRYYLCVQELRRIFPEAKFIVLTRNPISIFASSVEAFRNNTLYRLDHLDNDFTLGPKLIAEFCKYSSGNYFLLSYDNLVTNPSDSISKLFSYLNLDFSESLIEKSFKVKLEGHGDHLGAKKLDHIDQSLVRWKNVINSKSRKKRAIQMLNNFPDEYLSLQNLNKEELLSQLEKHEVSKFGVNDFFELWRENIYRLGKKIFS